MRKSNISEPCRCIAKKRYNFLRATVARFFVLGVVASLTPLGAVGQVDSLGAAGFSALSDDGNVVIGGLDGATSGFVWRADTGLEQLTSPRNGIANPLRISSDGGRIAGTDGDPDLPCDKRISSTPENVLRPVVWDSTSARILEPDGPFCYELADMSSDGSILVGTMWDTTGSTNTRALRRGWMWTNDNFTLLKPPQYFEVFIRAISGDGTTIVGGARRASDSSTVAIAIRNGAYTEVVDAAYAVAVNDNGSIVYVRNSQSNFVRVENGQQSLMPVPLGAIINDDESVMVYRGAGGGMIWTPDGGHERIVDHVTSLGIDPRGFQFQVPGGLTSDGRFVSGADYVGPGQVHGWRLRLDASCVAGKRAAAAPLIRWSSSSGGLFGDDTNWEDNESPGPDSIAVFGIGNSSYSVSLEFSAMNNRVDVDGDIVTMNGPTRIYDLVGELQFAEDGTCLGSESIRVLGRDERPSSLLLDRITTNAAGDVIVGRGPEPASLVVSGGRLTVPGLDADTATLVLGDDAGSDGTLLVELGGVVSNTWQTDLGRAPGASGTIQVEAESVLRSRLMTIGSTGNGEMRVANGGSVETDFLTVGVDASSEGRVLVSGNNSNLVGADVVTAYVVGSSGTGEVTIEDGAFVEQNGTSTTVIGNNEGAVGNVIVTGEGSYWRSEGLLVLASEGTGIFEISGGASAEFFTLNMGGGVSSDGTLRVEGSGSRFDVTSTDVSRANIGGGGISRVAVWDGGAFSAVTNIVFGAEPAEPSNYGTGELDVSGQGSAFAALVIAFGERGRGLGTVSNGGHLQVFDMWVGLVTSIDSTLNEVSIGNGGTVKVDSVLRVGGAPGLLRVTNGGQLKTVELEIGLEAGVQGEVRVSGSGTVTVTGMLTVGVNPASDASLRMLDGGTLTTAQATINGLVEGPITALPASPQAASKYSGHGLKTAALWIGPFADLDTDSLTVLDGGIVGGTGTLHTNYTNAAIIDPGIGDRGVGRFSIDGSFTQPSGGTLRIDVAGDAAEAYDRIAVSDTARLGGTLIVQRANGYVPTVGTQFEILTAPVVEGEFEVVSADDIRVNLTYTDTAVTLTVTSTVETEDAVADVPETLVLGRNYPNPSDALTTIPFDIPETGHVELVLFDVVGRRVMTLLDSVVPAGRHERLIDLSRLLSGVYLYTLRVSGSTQSRTLIVAH